MAKLTCVLEQNRRDALEASWGAQGKGSSLHPLQLGPGMTTCISRQQKLNQGQQRSVTAPAQTPTPQAVSSLWHGHGCDVHQLYCRAVIVSVLWLCSLRRWVEGTQVLNSGIPFSSAFRRQYFSGHWWCSWSDSWFPLRSRPQRHEIDPQAVSVLSSESA